MEDDVGEDDKVETGDDSGDEGDGQADVSDESAKYKAMIK